MVFIFKEKIVIVGYAITLAMAVALLIAYIVVVKKKEFWLTMLYICVAVVNLGYLLLSVSNSVTFAIIANDIAYLGSVFLAVCMYLIVHRLCGFEIKKYHIITCVVCGVIMFSMVATSGLLPWYYRSVTIETIDGATVLNKDYGVLHPLYAVYLFGYFTAMIVTIILSVVKKKMGKPKFAGLIAGIVCGNLLVWVFEKFIPWNFELLSVTYIMSELMLVLIYWMMSDYFKDGEVFNSQSTLNAGQPVDEATEMALKVEKVQSHLPTGEVLAPRERQILEYTLVGKKRKDIAEEMNLSENTIKTYVRNLYGKLGVQSREELYKLLED